VLLAKLRNRTCQGLDRQGQGQGASLQGQGLEFNLVTKESLRTRTRINITEFRSAQAWLTN